MVEYCKLKLISLTALLLMDLVGAFNLDVEMPFAKFGPENSYFGYSVAQHYIRDEPYVLVGAPRDSGLNGANGTGAFYSCKVNTFSRAFGDSASTGRRFNDWCNKAVLERLPTGDADPFSAGDRWTIKTDPGYLDRDNPVEYWHSWFGATISSSPARKGDTNHVLVCAPLLVFEQAAFTDGSCFLLSNDLQQIGAPLRDCKSDDKKRRHNTYGVCEQGFSAVLSEKYGTVITGLPGVVKWTGGAVARDLHDLTNYRDTKQRSGVGAVESTIPSHTYFGYSVNVGRFGFAHESVAGRTGKVYTLVFGSPRNNETGAVFFAKFHKDSTSLPVDQINDLKLVPNFYLSAAEVFASGFGYTIAVGDINNDGLDDLLVGAPYYFNAGSEQQRGGAVYVYFASGTKAAVETPQNVFLPPIKLYGPEFSAFGTSIAFLGDINEDSYEDFAVGAPFTETGGTVYIFLGGKRENFATASIQEIHGTNMSMKLSRRITTFGWSLAGGTDLDNNGYPDLVVGAFQSSAAVILRTRPVIHVKAGAKIDDVVSVDKDSMACNDQSGDVCFSYRTVLSVTKSKAYAVDLSTNLFHCKLEVLQHRRSTNPRAFFANTNQEIAREWPCGQNADRSPQMERHHFRLRKENNDWLNPLSFRFTVSRTPEARRKPLEGETMPTLGRHPVLDKRGATHEFLVPFNKKCGDDNECRNDLQLTCEIANLPWEIGQDDEKIYTKLAGGDDNTIEISYVLKNVDDRAYETMLYVEFSEADISYVSVSPSELELVSNPRKSPAIVLLGNPILNNSEIKFKLNFTITHGGADGLKHPLIFSSLVNSSSVETSPNDNNCSVNVKVVKKVHLEFTTEPSSNVLYYGGKIVGESAMTYIDDIGPAVEHVYQVKSFGPWEFNASIVIDFPYEVRSCKKRGFMRGKWALYVVWEPQIVVAAIGSTKKENYWTCHYDDPDGVNPLKLALTRDTAKVSQSNQMTNSSTESERKLGRTSRDLRIMPEPIPGGGGGYRVRISCAGHEGNITANCLRITCPLINVRDKTMVSVYIRARLWNSTFIEDYRDVEHVLLESIATLTLTSPGYEMSNGLTSSTVAIETWAQPDIPRIHEKRSVPIWVIVVSVIGGVFVLVLIIISFWKCGFFNRRYKDAGQPLYTAEYKHGEELDEN